MKATGYRVLTQVIAKGISSFFCYDKGSCVIVLGVEFQIALVNAMLCVYLTPLSNFRVYMPTQDGVSRDSWLVMFKETAEEDSCRCRS